MEAKPALINLREASSLKNCADRLLAWLVLTDEYGKPSDKFIDSFIYNFGDVISNGVLWERISPNRTELDNKVYSDKYSESPGGMLFYEFIGTLKGQSKAELKGIISDWDMEKAVLEEEDHVSRRVREMLRHPLLLEIKQRDADVKARFNPENKMFYLLKGSKIANETRLHRDDRIITRLKTYMSQGFISGELTVLKDIEFKSPSTLASFALLCNGAGINPFKVCGTRFTLKQVLDKEAYYDEAVRIQRLHNTEESNHTVNTETTEKVEEDMGEAEIVASMMSINTTLTSNNHHLAVDIVDRERDVHAVAIYSPRNGLWTLTNGKVCRNRDKCTSSLLDKSDVILNRALRDGVISSNFEVNTGEKHLRFSSLRQLSTFCIRSVTDFEYCYIHGTQVLLKDALDNKLKYRKYIALNQKDWIEEFGVRTGLRNDIN